MIKYRISIDCCGCIRHTSKGVLHKKNNRLFKCSRESDYSYWSCRTCQVLLQNTCDIISENIASTICRWRIDDD